MDSAATRTPAEVARAAFDAVIRKDPDGIVAAGAPGYVDDFVAIGEIRGHEAVRAFFRELFAAFPDFAMTVNRLVADETSAVVQWHAAGTFAGGPFQGIAPTGRRVEIRGVDVMEIADGLIQRNTIYYDGATFARQIGLLPVRGSRADQALLAAFNAKTTLSQRSRDRRRPRSAQA
ncbi:MAG: ester cyclase [Actinobacteria bacterium]|nr:ester cyclase [Actinomycetota bacterium]